MRVFCIRGKFRRCANVICMVVLFCAHISVCSAEEQTKSTQPGKAPALGEAQKIGYFKRQPVREKALELNGLLHPDAIEEIDRELENLRSGCGILSDKKREQREEYAARLVVCGDLAEKAVESANQLIKTAIVETLAQDQLDLIVDEADGTYEVAWLHTKAVDVTKRILTNLQKRIEFECRKRAHLDYYQPLCN